MRTKNWLTSVPNFFEKFDENKFYLVELIEQGDSYILGEISSEEYDSIMLSNQAIFEYEYFNRKVKEIDLNLEDFLNIHGKYSFEMANMHHSEDTIPGLMDEAFININRTFVNYINSCRIFIDHMEGKIKGKYGENSKNYKVFDKAKKYCYNTYFSYKFFYHLRNYAEHVNFPVYNINKSTSWKTINDLEKPVTEFKVFFNKDKLLESKYMSSKLKMELKYRNTLFPVLPVIEEFKKPINYMLNTLLKVEAEYYVENANILMSFSNKSIYGGKVEIGKFSRENGQIGYSPASPHVKIIEDIRASLSKLDSIVNY